MALLVGAALEVDLDAGELADHIFLAVALLGFEALDLLAAGFDLLYVVRRRRNGQVLREQVIPRVAGGDFDDVADLADVLDGFFEEEFDCG